MGPALTCRKSAAHRLSSPPIMSCHGRQPCGGGAGCKAWLAATPPPQHELDPHGSLPCELAHAAPVVGGMTAWLPPAGCGLCAMQVVDLTGSRDFLTTESTEQALAAMLAPGSAVAKASGQAAPCMHVGGI